MPEQKIIIQAHTGSDGMINLAMDIATGIINQDIQLTVSYEISEKETVPEDKFIDVVENIKPASNLAQYRKTITLNEDPLSFQERIRSEW